ncbi:IpaH family type III secretion system E3 ubiquitin--protein ligase [Yersinia pseudotuberculosis]|uniref:IpaH family type III secretion system E3 ubiquitin--protein ligase n=1 Tax=Yersinia pseudotuberculosis TaxID=633 RepID=UPI00061C18AD|nr:IpaH family type III secretion system E3 ubiquitin--protein ligase [Yersinia pseudotuberculosis]CNL44800.1 putative antigenic leucine-rich repeat protein [Yersinia pseudotuberculosis]
MNLSNITSNVSMPKIEPDREIHADRAVATALTPADYHAIWEKWASEAIPGANEQRDQAVARMKECLENNAKRLELNRLGLTSLPEIWPASLSSLDLSDNVLTQFPQNLPEGLDYLDVSSNRQLQEWPDSLPSSLEDLCITHCGFTTLGSLPPNLQELRASYNQINTLPDTWPASLSSLDLSNNVLTQFPQNLPEGMEDLTLSYNRQLQEWPDSLPSSLKELCITYCGFTTLGSLPPNLQELRASYNQINTLPDTWPASLLLLNLGQNALTQFPQNLPEGMEDLTLSYNRQLQQGPSSLPSSLKFLDIVRCGLTELSEAITRLPLTCRINLGQERSGYTHLIPANIRTQLRERAREVRLAQEAQQEHPSPINNLSDVIAAWLPAEQQDKLAEGWATIEQEDNAPAFSAFLSRLAGTASAKNSPEFRLQVAIWLAQLTGSPTLREQTFLIAQESTETCDDRVALTYNHMQKAVMAHEVEKGEYDTQLPELMARGRELFRLEQLENIAREKIKTLNINFEEEIEVYLAYQVKLRDSLQLFSVSKKMYFFDVSHVTTGDLQSAETRVKATENQDFPRWLSQWSPWKSVVQRIEPERYAAAVEKQHHALENIYPDKLAAELAANGMAGDVDANRIVGKRIMDDIMRKIDMALTLEVLSDKNALSLLDSQWNI